MNREVFLDSSFVIALVSPRDQYHSKAAKRANQLENEKPRVITTHGVFLEVGNALAKRATRGDAARAIASFQRDPIVEIVAINESLFERGFELYQRYRDKE